MADETDNLKVSITVDSAGAIAGVQAAIDKNDELKASLGAVKEAAQAAGAAQADAARSAADAVISASATETEAMIKAGAVALEQIRARAAQAAQAASTEASAEQTSSDLKIAVQIAYYRFLSEMGKQSSDEHRAQLEQLLADEQRTAAERLALQREIANVDKQIVEDSIAEYRAEAEAGVISADQQKAALRSIAEEALYSKSTRTLAAAELARIEIIEDKAAADAVIADYRARAEAGELSAAQQRAALETLAHDQSASIATRGAAISELGRIEKEETAASRESSGALRELSSGLVNLGYAGGPASGALMNIGYILPEITKMGPGLIAALGGIALALTAVAAAGAVLTESIKAASDMEAAMASLQATVRVAGGDWDSVSASVSRFADEVDRATIFSRDEAVGALRELVEAGNSVADSERLVALATDIASAKHQTLTSVVDVLRQAEDGRGRGLLTLDKNLRQVIESHGTLQQAVDILSKDFAGQASAATETLQGKQKMLQNALHDIFEELGERLLPAIETGADFLIVMARAAADHTSDFERFAEAVEQTASKVMDLGKIASYTFAVMSGNGVTALNDAKGAMGAWDDLLNHPRLALTAPTTLGSIPLFSFSGSTSASDWLAGAMAQQRTADQQRMREWNSYRSSIGAGAGDFTLDGDTVLGKEPKAKSGGAGFAFHQPADAKSEDALKSDDKGLKGMLDALSESEKAYANAVSDAIDADAKDAAQKALLRKEIGDSRIAFDLVSESLQKQQRELETAKTSWSELYTAAEHAKSTEDAYAATLGKDPSKDQRAHLAELRQKTEEATKAANDQKTTMDSLASSVDTLNSYLTNAQNVYSKATGELNKLNTEALLNAKTFDALSAAIEKDTAAAQKQADKRAELLQSFHDEIQMQSLSLQQQIAFLSQRYANLQHAGEEDTELANKTLEELLKLDEESYKQRIEAAKQYQEQAVAITTTLVDDVVAKHMSLRDTLKDVFKSIQDDFVQMIEQMILKSALIQGVEKSFGNFLGGIFGSSDSGNPFGSAGGIAGAQTGAAQYGILGAVGGAVGGSQIVSSIPTSSILSAIIGPTGASSVGTGTTYSGGGLGSVGSGLGSYLGAQSPYSDLPGFIPGSSPTGVSGGGLSVAGRYGGDILGGFGIGTTLAGITGGNATNGGLGGALGGLAAAITSANPLAGFALQLGGSLLGGLFGSHVSPATSPDIFDTQRYGTIIAALMGTSGANGQYFSEDSSTLSAFGGATGLSGVEQLLARGQSAFQTATGLSAQQYQQFLSMFGSSASGSGTLNFDKNIGQEYVTGASGAGGTYSYTQFGQALSTIETALSSHGGANAAIPVFTVQHTYPDRNHATSSQTGTVYGPASSSPNLANPVNAVNPSQPTVNVVVNGSIVGPNGVAGVASIIGKELRRIQAGESPGSYTNTVGVLSHVGDVG